ncbi:hypothetical protein GW17_00055481 [Ensete ventricosum]|nr:hypothetical protein GW17_00055481 [Ensete ventricosum]
MPTTRFADGGPLVARDIVRSRAIVGDGEELKVDVPSPALIIKESICGLGKFGMGCKIGVCDSMPTARIGSGGPLIDIGTRTARYRASPAVTDKNVNKVFDEMLMFVRVLRFMYIPCTTSSGLAWEVLRNDRKSCAKLTEVRGIANSKNSILMQGLVHGRRSVRGHPKARTKLGAMEHQNFLFSMKRIRP